MKPRPSSSARKTDTGQTARSRAAGPAPDQPGRPAGLLGGLTPQQFMRRHWQRRPLLISQALPGLVAPVTATELFALAARDDVESRLVTRHDGRWQLRHGPVPRRALPALKRPDWTLLVQGVEQFVPAAHALLRHFDFLPAARLDDVMLSFATDGGGVGPHVDSYDVFLLQVQGRRRWQVGPVAGDGACVPDLPLRILADFKPVHEWVLEPGDMLYLPPGWAHDGVAQGACMTCSIGLRAPRRDELAREVGVRVLDALGQHAADSPLYRDAGQTASTQPGAVPARLQLFAREAVRRALGDPAALDQALGEYLTEPKAQVWFESGDWTDWLQAGADSTLVLDARSRLLYDARHVFLNGESYRAGGRDARLLQQWADRGMLSVGQARGLSADAQKLLQDWLDDGWVHVVPAA